MTLSEKESLVIEWYDRNATTWAGQRKSLSEPSFWDEEYTYFKQVQKPPGALLEIGSGSGREALEWIRMGYEYSGIETSKNLMQIAKQTALLGHYYLSSVYQLPFPSNSFDAFSSWAMLPHIPKERIAAALASIRSVLKPNALGFIAMREGEGESQETNTGRWFSYYTQSEFETILQKNGYTVEKKGRKQSHVAWLTFFVRVI
jgi:ubiquinone/menaquinone biosynthesis C-methylase UbiE